MPNPIYLIEHQGKVGRYFIECDRDTNSRQFAIGLIRSGEVNPVKVLEVVEDEGTCRDVTEEFLHCAKWGDHLSPDYRTTMTGEDKAAWEADRRRAEEMVS
jgi:hypothetical protein